MRALTAPELLRVWEEGRGRPLAERALLLLGCACPDEPREDLLSLSVGRRDARLLRLREWTFGPWFTSLARCPACGERLELSFGTADVLVQPEEEPQEVLRLSTEGYDVTFRLPTGADLAALEGAREGGDARDRLLERCLLSARRNGRSRPVGRLPAAVLHAVVERMGEADPQADVRTPLACPACAHAWEAAFDIVSFFWTEIERWAYRTLQEVHVLARAYAWRESDILALSPARRQLYLEMVHA